VYVLKVDTREKSRSKSSTCVCVLIRYCVH